jgi:hypothetical protein
MGGVSGDLGDRGVYSVFVSTDADAEYTDETDRATARASTAIYQTVPFLGDEQFPNKDAQP